MSDRKQPRPVRDFNPEPNTRRSFTPPNRRKDGALFREIGERIRAGYYESSELLKAVAERISGMR